MDPKMWAAATMIALGTLAALALAYFMVINLDANRGGG